MNRYSRKMKKAFSESFDRAHLSIAKRFYFWEER